MKQFLKFGLIGTIGFIIDASILLFLVNVLLLEISTSRFFSFLIAVLVTWLLNRKFTFNNKKSNYSKRREYSYYLSIQTLGVFFNYAIFIILVKTMPFFEQYLVLPLAVSSIIIMFFNFFMLKKRVYN